MSTPTVSSNSFKFTQAYLKKNCYIKKKFEDTWGDVEQNENRTMNDSKDQKKGNHKYKALQI